MPAIARSTDPTPRTTLGTARLTRWWQGEAGAGGRLLDTLLAPAELAYRIGAVAYHGAYASGLRHSASPGVPAVSVGNLLVGGTGKTPVAAWLVGELRRRGARPGLLHGGYAADEPELHRQWHPDAPVVAERDRLLGARRAIAAGATVLVLDDAFQHRRLARDLDLVLVPAESWNRSPRLLPRGPWREAPAALARATMIAVIRKVASADDAQRVSGDVAEIAPGRPVLRLWLRADRWRRAGTLAECAAPPDPALAVAGIGQPDAFLHNAGDAGARIDEAILFPDHHGYRPPDIERIRSAAAGRPIVTTAKDAVKLEAFDSELDLWILEQQVEVEDGAALLARILDQLVV